MTGADKSHCPMPGASAFSDRASEKSLATCPWANDFFTTMNSLFSGTRRFEGWASKFCLATCPRASASEMYLSAPVKCLQ